MKTWAGGGGGGGGGGAGGGGGRGGGIAKVMKCYEGGSRSNIQREDRTKFHLV